MNDISYYAYNRFNGSIHTVAGQGPVGLGKGGYGGDDGPATQARFDHPIGLAALPDGGFAFASPTNHRVRLVSVDGIVRHIAGSDSSLPPGSSTGGASGDGGPARQARLNQPAYLAVDRDGTLYITVSSRVRKVAPDGTITTAAGGGKRGTLGEGGPATAAALDHPVGIAVDSAGTIYIADVSGHRVRKVVRDGTITTVAGTGRPGFSGDGGPVAAARLNYPSGLAVDTAGNLFIGDTNNFRVRKVSPDGVISTVVGSGKQGDPVEGPSTESPLRGPWGIAIDASGALYIGDIDTMSGLGFPAFDAGFGGRVLRVDGVAAPGLLAGAPFPDAPVPVRGDADLNGRVDMGSVPERWW